MSAGVQGPESGLLRRQVLFLGLGPWLLSGAAAAGGDVQLASVWPSGQSPQGFLVSEKYDGVRALWDGQVLRFRSGRVIAAPAWFVAALPAMPLDGELWMGRGQFDLVSGAVRRTVPDDAQWRELRYMVFDVWGLSEPFAQRVGRLVQAVSAAAQPWLVPVTHEAVETALALQARLQQVVKQGGEGLVSEGFFRTWPHLHQTDGFFAAVWRKR